MIGSVEITTIAILIVSFGILAATAIPSTPIVALLFASQSMELSMALILPICMNSFNIIVLRTFFKTSIPDAVVESAKIDQKSDNRSCNCDNNRHSIALYNILPCAYDILICIQTELFWNKPIPIHRHECA